MPRKSQKPVARGKFRKLPKGLLTRQSKKSVQSSSEIFDEAQERTQNKKNWRMVTYRRAHRWRIRRFLPNAFGSVNRMIVGSVAVFAVCIAAFVYLKQNAPVKLESSLTDVRSISLDFSDFQSEGYSPVCGCYGEQRPENWRGVAFAARHVVIERKGDLPATAYMMTVAAPRRISWASRGERFNGDLYFVSIPDNETFNPKKLFDKTTNNYRLLEEKHFDPKRYFMMFSEFAVNVDLLGDKPLGAWIPSDGSKVTVGYSKDKFPASKLAASIVENYNLLVSESSLQEIVGMPLGDFLGPNIVIWSEDPNIKVLGGKSIFASPSPEPGAHVVTAFVANPPFSLRLACIPEVAEVAQDYKEELAQPEVQNANEDYLVAVRHPPSERGSVTVSIPDIEDYKAEFQKVYESLKKNDVVGVQNIPGDFDFRDIRTGKDLGKRNSIPYMEFRYPPIPPNPGFNIFGSFKSVDFAQVKGKVLIGSHPFDIGVASNLSLKDITSLKVDGDVIQIPLRWDSSENSAEIHLQATAKATLNGEPLESGFDVYKPTVELVLLLSAIISAAAAVIQVILVARNKRSLRSSP